MDTTTRDAPMTDSEVTEYLIKMREHANPEVQEFFADKVSEAGHHWRKYGPFTTT